MSKTFDLSTLELNLSPGNHPVVVRAKGTGYTTSADSNSVTWVLYAVKFYNGETLLQTSAVAWNGTAVYTGATPVYDGPDPEDWGDFKEWQPSPEQIVSDTDCYAVFTFIGIRFRQYIQGTLKDWSELYNFDTYATRSLSGSPDKSITLPSVIQMKSVDFVTSTKSILVPNLVEIYGTNTSSYTRYPLISGTTPKLMYLSSYSIDSFKSKIVAPYLQFLPASSASNWDQTRITELYAPSVTRVGGTALAGNFPNLTKVTLGRLGSVGYRAFYNGVASKAVNPEVVRYWYSPNSSTTTWGATSVHFTRLLNGSSYWCFTDVKELIFDEANPSGFVSALMQGLKTIVCCKSGPAIGIYNLSSGSNLTSIEIRNQSLPVSSGYAGQLTRCASFRTGTLIVPPNLYSMYTDLNSGWSPSVFPDLTITVVNYDYDKFSLLANIYGAPTSSYAVGFTGITDISSYKATYTDYKTMKQCGVSLITSNSIPSDVEYLRVPSGVTLSSYSVYSSTLKNLSIDWRYTSLPDDFVSGCSSLTEFDANNPNYIDYANRASKLTSIGSRAFMNCGSLSSIGDLTFVLEVKQSSFKNCSSLTMVDLVMCLNVGDNAFEGCTSVWDVNLPLVTQIGSSAFSQCNITSINIENVVTLGEGAFSNGLFTPVINIPHVKSLPSSCFSNTGLEYFRQVFITRVGDDCFSGSSLLKEALVPSVNYIGARAFKDCTSLTGIALPKVTCIGTDAFKSCTSFTWIELLSSSKVTLEGDPFVGTPIASGTGFIYVPEELVSTYQTATNWSLYSSQILSITSITPFRFPYSIHEFYMMSGFSSVTSVIGFTDGSDSYYSVYSSPYADLSLMGLSPIYRDTIPTNVSPNVYVGSGLTSLSLRLDNIRKLVIGKSSQLVSLTLTRMRPGTLEGLENCSPNSIYLDNYDNDEGELTSVSLPNFSGSLSIGMCLESLYAPLAASITVPNSFAGVYSLYAPLAPYFSHSYSSSRDFGVRNAWVKSMGRDNLIGGDLSVIAGDSRYSYILDANSSSNNYRPTGYNNNISLYAKNGLYRVYITSSIFQDLTSISGDFIMKIRVPEELVSTYQTATNWSLFSSIIGPIDPEEF